MDVDGAEDVDGAGAGAGAGAAAGAGAVGAGAIDGSARIMPWTLATAVSRIAATVAARSCRVTCVRLETKLLVPVLVLVLAPEPAPAPAPALVVDVDADEEDDDDAMPMPRTTCLSFGGNRGWLCVFSSFSVFTLHSFYAWSQKNHNRVFLCGPWRRL